MSQSNSSLNRGVSDSSMNGHVSAVSLLMKMGGITPIRVVPVGSRVTSPAEPRVDADFDILLFVKSPDLQFARVELAGVNFECNSKSYADQETKFTSWKRGLTNVLLTDDADFVNKFLVGTELATRFGLVERKDRIALFMAVRGEYQHAYDTFDI